MIPALLIASVLFVGILTAHYAVPATSRPRLQDRGTIGFVGMSFLLFVLHLAEVGVFAGGYELGRALGLGDFKRPAEVNFMDVYYFSLTTFTTLGLGKAMPTGHLASLAGLESFTGFLCIAMSGSAFFRWVQREA